MGDKIIKNMDDEVWRKFTSVCRAKGIQVNEAIKVMVESYTLKMYKEEIKKIE